MYISNNYIIIYLFHTRCFKSSLFLNQNNCLLKNKLCVTNNVCLF